MNRAYKTNCLRLRQRIMSGLQRTFAIQQKYLIIYDRILQVVFVMGFAWRRRPLCFLFKDSKTYTNSFGSDL